MFLPAFLTFHQSFEFIKNIIRDNILPRKQHYIVPITESENCKPFECCDSENADEKVRDVFVKPCFELVYSNVQDFLCRHQIILPRKCLIVD